MKRILVVTADHSNVKAIIRSISGLGHASQLTLSSQGAVSALQAGGLDTVLVVDAPELCIEICKRLRSVDSTVPIITIAPNATGRQFKALLAAGCLEVLLQPWTEAELSDAIGKALEIGHEGMMTTVHGLGVFDLLQMFHQTRRSVCVRFDTDAAVYVEDGELIHAEVRRSQGFEALVEVLGAQFGAARTDSLGSPPRTLDLPFQHLMLETTRRLDEQLRDRIGPPSGEESTVEHNVAAKVSRIADIVGPPPLPDAVTEVSRVVRLRAVEPVEPVLDSEVIEAVPVTRSSAMTSARLRPSRRWGFGTRDVCVGAFAVAVIVFAVGVFTGKWRYHSQASAVAAEPHRVAVPVPSVVNDVSSALADARN